jgi:hypothetical protein
MMECHEAFNLSLERFAIAVLGKPKRTRRRKSA